jgi:hypothetical protein
MVRALAEDYQNAPISEQDRVMLDYVVQVTKDATRISPADHERLRAVGFDDKGILQITLIASWFNYINRVADALGVGRDLFVATKILWTRSNSPSPRSGRLRIAQQFTAGIEIQEI